MNLARLAAYRRQTEDSLRLELATVARLLQEAAERAVALEDDVVAKQCRYAEVGRGGVTVAEAHDWYAEIETASDRVAHATAAHGALHREWMRKQAELIEAMQERKKLDILLRRRMETRLREQAQADQRLMDEQAARRRSALQCSTRGTHGAAADTHEGQAGDAD